MFGERRPRELGMLRHGDLGIRRVGAHHPIAGIGEFAWRLANVLELGEHLITKAFSSETALDQLTQDDIDITFVEVTLPRMDGIDVLRVFRELRPNRGSY